MTERRVSVRMTAVGGQQVKAELQGIGEAGAVAMQRTAVETQRLNQRMSELGGSGSSGGLRNAALQLNQVAQQGAVTGNYLQALMIQLPDLLIGFGTMGAVAGIAAGALGPLALTLIQNADQARTLEDAMKDLGQVAEDLKEPMDVLALSADELTEKYGGAAAQVRKFALDQAELNAIQAERRLSDQAALAAEEVDSYFTRIDAGRAYLNTLREIEAQFGVTNEEARRLEQDFQALGTATLFDDQVAALEGVLATLRDMGVPLSAIPDELARAISEMITLQRETAEVERLMRDAASAAREMSSGVPLYMQAGAMGNLLPPEQAPDETPPVRRRAGGGGARVDTEQRRREQDARRLFEQTRTEAEQYAAEVERINQLHAEFGDIVTDEVVARALADLDAGLEKAGSGAKAFQSSAESAFVAFITGAQGAQEAIGSLLGDLGRLVAQQAFRSLFNASGIGGVLGLPGFANGTSFAPGGLALVGERGPEIVNLPRGSQVFSNEASRRMAGGGAVFNIDARGAERGAADDIVAAIEARVLPKLRGYTVAAVKDASRRGA